MDSPAVMLQGMSGSVLGVWSSHGEGKAHFPNEKVLASTLADNLAPIRYANDDGEVTEAYPFNPNGSVEGIAGLCSKDGRHLCLMPHPDRSFLQWQLPWIPNEWRTCSSDSQQDVLASPWLKMFHNARIWVDEHRKWRRIIIIKQSQLTDALLAIHTTRRRTTTVIRASGNVGACSRSGYKRSQVTQFGHFTNLSTKRYSSVR